MAGIMVTQKPIDCIRSKLNEPSRKVERMYMLRRSPLVSFLWFWVISVMVVLLTVLRVHRRQAALVGRQGLRRRSC